MRFDTRRRLTQPHCRRPVQSQAHSRRHHHLLRQDGPLRRQSGRDDGLPHQPEACDISHKKDRTRAFALAVKGVFFSVESTDDLKAHISHTLPLKYPLIVKPNVGVSSEGVVKVASEEGLFDAVRKTRRNSPARAP